MEVILRNRLLVEPQRTISGEQHSIRRWTVVAAVSTGLTVISTSVGLALSVLPHLVETPLVEKSSRFGSILIAAVFPLLILTAHCLDKIDRADKRLRNARLSGDGSTAVAFKTALAVLSVLVLPSTVISQQTIFNVPNTDVLEKGGVYVELDAAFNPVNQPALRRFSSFVPWVVVGIGCDVEIGLNATGNIQPGTDTTTLVPTAKWRLYRNPKSKVDLVAGTNLYIPVRRPAFRFGLHSYLSGSKSFGKTRLTAGVFVATKSVFAPNAVRGGGQFGFEQTVTRKLTFAADWMTGRHANGFLTTGIIYKPHPRVTTYWSYSISNSGATNGNHFFLFEAGYNF